MTLLIATLLMTHATIVCVTLYLHRSQTHRSVEFHPLVAHAMRLWLWLSTGMVSRQWVAIHRSHHRHSDQSDDPHSPHVWGIWRVLFGGAWLYNQAAQNSALVNQYGVGTPDDWIERNLYTAHSRLGILLMLIIDLLLFGPWGLMVWGVQMLWVPFHAAGIINGLAHWWGYKNGPTKDQSRNISPWGIWIGGEELHSNHHQEPASAKLSRKWFEFDEGWMWICILRFFKLAEVR